VALDLLAPGVYCWLQLPSRLGRANAGVVVDEDGITLIDALAVPSQYEPFAADVEALGFPIRRLVLTSSHIEFAGGTVRFRLPGVYGSPQVSAHLDQAADPGVLRRLVPELAEEIDDDVTTRTVSHVVDAAVQLTPATAVFPMSGELEESLVVLVPGADVLFAGAACSFGVTPLCYQGDPATWADALDELAAMATVIVPGHGDVGGEEEVRDLQAYLRACVTAAGDVSRLAPGPWESWTGREHDVVNVERAAMLSRGDDGIPRSLLTRLGL
jgi:cyclase